MKKKSINFLNIIFILMLILCSIIYAFNYYLNTNKNLRVAHAGGQYLDFKYPNSTIGINKNKNYIKYFELDLQLTKDNRLICLHDPVVGDLIFEKVYDIYIRDSKKCYDEEIKELIKQEIYLITDFKTNNIEGLKYIRNNYNDLSKFIPQIYNIEEYYLVEAMGFDKIIFSLYKLPNTSNETLLNYIDQMNLFAVTMDPARLRRGLAHNLKEKKLFTYTHTVNSYLRFIQYKFFYSVDEIYTDNLF